MFGMGMPEILLIMAIALVVIGPSKLPDLAKSLGRAMREFRSATSEFKDSLDLDGDLKEVRQTFGEVNDEVKKAVAEESPAAAPKDKDTESTAPVDEKLSALKQAFDELNPPTSPETDREAGPEEAAGSQEETPTHDR